jgi:hypothetical protein
MRVRKSGARALEKQIATNFNERRWSLVAHGVSTDFSYVEQIIVIDAVCA